MAEVDYDALDTASKALIIIFIILIVLSNAGHIFKIVKRNLTRFVSDIKKMTIISLAIGDIFLALFPLVIQATELFQGPTGLTCASVLSETYLLLLNFVYGTGLIVLAVDLILRMLRCYTGGQSIKIAVIISALPWILGLIIVLPLTMAHMNWDLCKVEDIGINMQRNKYIVSICTPATLALLVSIFTRCVPHTTHQGRLLYPPATQVPSQNPTRPADASTKNMPLQPTTAPGYNPQALNPYPPQPYPRDATSPPQYTHPAPHKISYDPENVYVPQPTYNLPTVSTTNFGKENITLIVVCLVYFICVIPFSGFTIGYILNVNRPMMDDMARTVMYHLFYWLLICRSVLTPLIWIGRLDN